MTDLEWPAVSWDYRVMLCADKTYSIREVHYDGAGSICWWSMFPSDLGNAGDVEDLWEEYGNMGDAFEMPILMEADLENQFRSAK